MTPAFASPRQAAAFALLLASILALPFLGAKWGLLPPREAVYSSLSWLQGDYPYMDRQIFEEKSDVDVAFLGSSHIWAGIDTPYVRDRLGAALGRPANVITLGWAYSGIDALYTVAHDLLAHRRVRLLVIYDDAGPGWPQQNSWHWERFGENAPELAGLPAKTHASYYYAAVLGMPRNLLNRLRPNEAALPEQAKFEPTFSYPPDTGGAQLGRKYYDRQGTYREYVPQNSTTPADVRVFGPLSQGDFGFQTQPMTPFQTHFAKLLLSLVREKGTRLACINIPVFTEDRRSAVIASSRFWPDLLKDDAPLAGIAPARFFDGVDDEGARLLFQNSDHLSENGARYFTRLITPTLIEFHAQANR